jgi:peroxiredoxin
MKIALIPLCIFISTTISSGQNIWDFTLKDVDNNMRSLQDLKGEKVTVIDFWTTWCKPCRKSIPELNKIYENYKDTGLQVIGVNCDGPRSIAKVAPYTHSLQIKYPVLLDINSEIMNSLNLANFPTMILIDNNGNIDYVHEGFVAGDEQTIRNEIEKHLSN